jgi:SPP1 family predicted phage head-tail adaptor
MNPGELRHRITIEAPTDTQNEYGEPVQGWQPIATVWAAKQDLAGREFVAAQQTQAEVTTRFRLRYRDGITAKMRIRTADGTLYNVASVQDPDGYRRETIIMAKREG